MLIDKALESQRLLNHNKKLNVLYRLSIQSGQFNLNNTI